MYDILQQLSAANVDLSAQTWPLVYVCACANGTRDRNAMDYLCFTISHFQAKSLYLYYLRTLARIDLIIFVVVVVAAAAAAAAAVLSVAWALCGAFIWLEHIVSSRRAPV